MLDLPPLQFKRDDPEHIELVETLRRTIEAGQEQCLGLATEKVLLAQQATELVKSWLGGIWVKVNSNCPQLAPRN